MLETFLHYAIIAGSIALIVTGGLYAAHEAGSFIHHAIRDRHARQYRSPRR